MPTRRSHELVVDFLRRGPLGRLLDIPAGNGKISAAARELGWQVCELDLFPHPGLRGVRADACAPLPFRDASFDALVCMEGIEHFEDQTGFLRECARVLKPGGRLILTTPNVLHLSSRISGFWTGQRMMRQGFVNEVSTTWKRDGERIYHGHAYLIDAFRLRYILRVVGLRIVDLALSNPSAGSMLLAPLVPAVWAATRYAIVAGRKHEERHSHRAPSQEIERDLQRLALSPALLFGKKLVLVAERERG
jgi:SAM-dependent methyltransferase